MPPLLYPQILWADHRQKNYQQDLCQTSYEKDPDAVVEQAGRP